MKVCLVNAPTAAEFAGDLEIQSEVVRRITLEPHSDPQINLLAPLAATPLHRQYQNQLTLDTLCSDISHQGEQQSAKDVLLIREYSEIFPNFYLLPTPNLDRNLLLELREFALMGVEHFRWLLVALDQATSGMLDLFSEWRRRRLDLWPDLQGFEIRRYYRSQTFRTDFLRFARGHPAAKHPLVQTFLEYEDAMRFGTSSDGAVFPRGVSLAPGSELWWSDVPVRKEGARVIDLPCDILGAIDALRQRSEPRRFRGHYYYVTREVTDGGESLDMISDWVASALGFATAVDRSSKRLSNSPMRFVISIQMSASMRSCGYWKGFMSTD